MKITILLVIAVFAVLATGVPAPRKSAFINKEIVDAIRKSGATWEAYDPEENPLRKYSDDELRHFLGVPGMDPAATLAGIKNAQLHMPKAGGRTLNINEPSKATINVAASFDWRTSADGTRCKPNVLTQGSCGGCYSFTTAEVFAARYCQAKSGASAVDFSPQDILACNSRTTGCGGGVLDLAFGYLEDYGITTLACRPYQESNTPDTGASLSQKCLANKCADGTTVTKYFCKKGTSIILYGTTRIQNEISLRGPLGTQMTAYSDLLNYKSGIYTQTTGTNQGGHAVVLIGWGTDGTTPYWIVQNSWGTDWGESGYFKANMADTKAGVGGAAYYCVPETS